MILDKFYKKPGVYIITCVPTMQIYIGRSVNVRKRLASHFSKLRCKRHKNTILQQEFDKYGEDSFTQGVLMIQLNHEPNELNLLENTLIDTFDSYNNGFNLIRDPKNKRVLRPDSPLYRADWNKIPVFAYNPKTKEFEKYESYGDGGKPSNISRAISKALFFEQKSWGKTEKQAFENYNKRIQRKEPKTSRPCLDTETGIYYNNIKECTDALGYIQSLYHDKRKSGGRYLRSRIVTLKDKSNRSKYTVLNTETGIYYDSLRSAFVSSGKSVYQHGFTNKLKTTGKNGAYILV